jgi:hypothetical protein
LDFTSFKALTIELVDWLRFALLVSIFLAGVRFFPVEDEG